MEEPPDGLTNSINLGPESCFVRGDGFEPRLSFKFEVRELALKLFSCDLEYLVEFRCRPFPSVFGAPWPSASRPDFRSSTYNSFARLLASSSLILVMASLTPARSLVAWVTHATSICGSSMDFNALSTSPVVTMTSLVAPEKSFSSIDSMFFGRVCSALWSVSTASLPSPRVRKPLRLALNSPSEVIAMLKGLKNTRTK